MKKQNLFKILVLALAMVMLFSTVTACDKGDDGEPAGDPTVPATTTTTPPVNPPTPPAAAITINIVNGYNLDDETNIIELDKPQYVRIQANAPESDKMFSHWIDKDGNIVKDDFTMRIKVWESNTYTAVYIPKHIINIINGYANDTTWQKWPAATDEEVKLVAKKAPTGFAFSHWEDETGAKVGEDEVLTIVAKSDKTYKAYYTVEFGPTTATPINTNISTDWKQGGFKDDFTRFESKSTSARISFAEPYLLKAGSTLVVSLPYGHKCPEKALKNCATKGLDCTLSASLSLVKPKADVTGDYTFTNLLDHYIKVGDPEWIERGFTYTATEDVYIMITVKYTNHADGANTKITTSTAFMKNVVIIEKPASEETEKIGNYWTAELDTDMAKVEANRTTVGAPMSEFFFLTDIHWNLSAKASPALIAYLAEQLRIHNIISGGDVSAEIDPPESTTEEEAALVAARKLLDEFYAMLKDYTEVGDDCNFLATVGKTDIVAKYDDLKDFSYFDDAANKVRYIQFAYTKYAEDETMDLFNEKILPLLSEKVKELGADWTVVLFSHSFFGTKNENGIANTLLTLQGEADAEIAAWIVGGTHEDVAEVIYDEAGNKLNVLAMNADSYANGTDNNYATATEHAISILQLDLAGKKIYVTRVGSGDDQIVAFGQDNITGTKLYEAPPVEPAEPAGPAEQA